MSTAIDKPGKPWRAWLLALSCGFSAGGSAQAGEPRSAGSTPLIQVVTVERDCFGCANSSRLSLHRNGTAFLTLSGKARHGTQDQRSRARLALPDFEALAALLQAQGFFAMAESYDDPEMRDGAWVNWQVERDGEVKQVFRRGGCGPEALAVLDAAVADLQARLRFNPEP
ncbi:hypothetical protein [Paucibacter sp. DJ2R-2]|uniref:hypothetical protein n=1 Tax=Paucibacter sp. DJ2R-2 TaxID=2893558 RepID=UPI0021E5124B|nr:hypothetical protein [Paucibacter sp. DJ2R-2]MCV2419654.1 hypothetical protein [Paucibacter sp. DJ4R-1]MCV2437442.1 hypothetical protein [Paucibacter sp. DJ2R-2]